MELEQFFEQILELSYPYKIIRVEQNESPNEAIHIYIKVDKKYHPEDAESKQGTRHDKEERIWRHLDLFQYPCYIHCEVPKYKYRSEKGDYVKTLEVPWSRPKSGFTLLFEQSVMSLVKLHGVVARVAKQVGEYKQRIQGIVNYYEPLKYIDMEALEKEDTALIPVEKMSAEILIESNELSGVKNLKIDETSRKKGHDYVTNFIDGDTGNLLDIQQGKGSKAIERFVKKGLSRGLNVEQITDISIDMSPAFICGVEFYFENGMISIDKFHVTQLINRCFDSFRKSEGRKRKGPLPKWSIVKPIESLNQKEHQEMASVLDQFPRLDEFHEHKNKFSTLWKYDNPEEGAAFFSFWIGRLEEMGNNFKNKKMLTLVKTLNKHFDRIINVLKSGMDNAISEGFNNKVQIMKRVARGYKNFENYIQMIKLHCDLGVK
jgi:transposase